MGLGDIRRDDVLGAIALLDDPAEGPRLLDQLHFGPARYLRVVYQGRFYDSKAVAGIAHGLGAGGSYLTNRDFKGGEDTVAACLERLGFYIDRGFLYDLTQLRVDRTHGRPAPYQYVVLLWAIARARSGLPRMVPFDEVRDELAAILAPFALAQSAPDPAMPWLALRNSSWWELQTPVTPSGLTDADVQQLNLVAGLAESRYDRSRDDAAFASAAVDVIRRTISEEPALVQLLDRLGLAPYSDSAHREGTSASGSHALVVTWNPDGEGTWAKQPEEYQYAIFQTRRDLTVEGNWSTGNRKTGVSSGDPVFLLQQGDKGRGIIGSGTIRGEIRQTPHWDQVNHPGKEANTVDLEWERVVPVEYILSIEVLNRDLPGINWSPQSSGMLIEGDSVAKLRDLWSSHLAEVTESATDPVLSTNALVWPMLQAMKALGRPAHIQEIDAAVIQQQNVSPEVQAVPHGNGPTRKLNYRLRWARTELQYMGAIEKVEQAKRGTWRVTSVGEALTLDEFEELLKTRKGRQSGDTASEEAMNSRFAEAIREDGFETFGRPGTLIIERVARAILHDCLVRDGSLLGGSVWTRTNLAELHTAYVDNPDTSKTAKFYDKLRKQLADVSDEARQLFAELFILNILPISDLTVGYKLSHTTDILDPITPRIEIPALVTEAFAYGMVNGGQGFNNTRGSQLSLLVEFGEYFKQQDPDIRMKAADDPLLMRQFIFDSPGRTEASYRHLLLCILHPEFFIPVINLNDRLKLRNALAKDYLAGGATDDLDVDLRHIDDAVIAEVGQPVDYYAAPWVYRWLKSADKSGDEKAGEQEPKQEVEDTTAAESPYVVADIINDGCFQDQAQLKQILERWADKKNLILQGPPGTGKTWLARRLAYALIGFRAKKEVRSVQFHPNTSYEDFVRGWRPSITNEGAGKLVLTDGPLIRHAEDARRSPVAHVLIIEEINRGNPAQAFGEMLTLIEESKRDEQDALALSYPREEGELYFLPDNLYLLGTMNIADRSLALVDFALRRRFAFETLEPAFTPAWENYLRTRLPNDQDLVMKIRDKVLTLNARISEDATLGPNFAIVACSR